MERTNVFLICIVTIVTVIGSGCSRSDGEQTLSEPAQVERIEIIILESFPVQVHVRIYGILPDSCTELGYIAQRREENVFVIRVSTKRPAKAVCADAITRFEEVVVLDVYGLPAETYTVDVNGVRDTFTLDMENRID